MDGWDFWIPAAAMTLMVAVMAVLALLRGAAAAAPGADRRAVRVYSDQLREIDRDQARGLIAPDEAERLRLETARRLLEADRSEAAQTADRAPRRARTLGLALVAAAVAVAAGVYVWRGAPMYADRPLALRLAEAAQARAERPAQAELQAMWLASPQRLVPAEPEPELAALLAQLRDAVAQRPDDLTGHRLLAQNEARLGRMAEAAAAQTRVVALLPDTTPTPERLGEWTRQAQYMIAAAGGIISPEAEAVLEEILRADPANGFARFFVGVMFDQTGRPDLTFQLWRRLLDDSAPDAPWVPDLRANLETLAEVAGVRYTLPPAAGSRGPTFEDVEAAAALDPEARAAMIGGMVEGLSARLGAQGGPAQDWARLIQALGVLGQQGRAQAILAEARLVFADDPAGWQMILGAARAAGLDG